MSGPVDDLIAEGRTALRRGNAADARRAFQRACDESESGEAIEGLARASYLELAFEPAMSEWERAYSVHRDNGNVVGAVRVARTLAYMNGSVRGDGAVMSGWIARAQTLLGDESETPERGWIELQRGMFSPDRDAKEAHFRTALHAARRFHDTDLELVALAYLGASLVHADRTEEGMLLLDEALAALLGHEADDFFVLQEIFCQLFSACEYAHDIVRADQWIRIGESLAEQRNIPAVSAFCHTHYGGVLTAAGRWPEADAALTEAVRVWGLGHRTLRAGALIRLADLRVRQGRYEEAEQLLAGLDTATEAARPLAGIYHARGETTRAVETLERALEQLETDSTAAAALLAFQVDVCLSAGLLDEAGRAAEQLAACAARHPSSYLDATAALARGRVCLATATGDAQGCLREALAGFARAEMPIEVAQSRLELAHTLIAERPEVAMAEARAALEVFDQLEAARHADAAAALLRSLGVRTATAKRGTGSVLTKREAEVLELVGHGLSNPEIADRLFISRKTVEHHVGNILSKLGLRSRAEAAAYAARTKPAAE